MDVYKHYIRVEGGIVVHGFSDAFEQPQDGDIILSGDFGRHFQFNLLTDRLQFKHKITNGQMVARTKEELDAEWTARTVTPDPDVELATAITNATTLEELKKALLGYNGNLARVKGKMK